MSIFLKLFNLSVLALIVVLWYVQLVTCSITTVRRLGKTKIFIQENGHKIAVQNSFNSKWLNLTVHDVNDVKRPISIVTSKPTLSQLLSLFYSKWNYTPKGDVHFENALSHKGKTSAFSIRTNKSSDLELCWNFDGGADEETTSWFNFYGNSLSYYESIRLLSVNSDGFALGFLNVWDYRWRKDNSSIMCLVAETSEGRLRREISFDIVTARDPKTASESLRDYPFQGVFPIQWPFPTYNEYATYYGFKQYYESRKDTFSEPIWSYSNELELSIENLNKFLLNITEYSSSSEFNKTTLIIHFGSKYKTMNGNFVTLPMDSSTFHRAFSNNSLQLSFPVSHYISNSSDNFERLKNLLTKDEEGHVIVTSNSGHGFLDLEQNEVLNWFEEKLKELCSTTGIDSFRFDGPQYGWIDTDLILQSKDNSTSISLYFDGNCRAKYFWMRLPMFFQIDQRVDSQTNIESTLQSLISTVLSLGLSGQVFIVPNLVFDPQHKPSPELYIRWIEAVSLMPIMKLSLPPWTYHNQTVNQIVRKFIKLHREYSRDIVDLANNVGNCEQINPIIRPLWYVYLDDPQTYAITDQFMLGSSTLVAPVLREGQRSRSVYLPKGIWIDQHEEKFNGPNWFIVSVPLDELAHFKLFEPERRNRVT